MPNKKARNIININRALFFCIEIYIVGPVGPVGPSGVEGGTDGGVGPPPSFFLKILSLKRYIISPTTTTATTIQIIVHIIFQG